MINTHFQGKTMITKPIQMPESDALKESCSSGAQHSFDGHVVTVCNSREEDDNRPRECVQGKVFLRKLLEQPKLGGSMRPFCNLLCGR